MWNFRAFDEREFYRVDHYLAAMGVLCHPNYKNEKSNGVGVSIDPIYLTENTFYLNTQLGESLITNPEANAIPEEILLNEDPEVGYFVLRKSNLVEDGELVMGEEYLDQMREYLKVIHDNFAVLYNVVGAEGFGMDIEYKVTVDDQLIIKQARPWVSFWANIKATFDLAVEDVVNPQNSSTLGEDELVTVKIANQGLREMNNFDISLLLEDQIVETITVEESLNSQTSADYQFTIPQNFSTIGDYNISAIVSHPSDGYELNDTLATVVSKLHFLEGGITVVEARSGCGNEVEVVARVTNYGEATFVNTVIEVVSNGMVVDTIYYDFNIPYLVQVDIAIPVTDNIQSSSNEIRLNLLSVNGQEDAISENNNSSTIIEIETRFDFITFVLNVDNFPQETSWQLFDVLSDESVASGNLINGNADVNENICVDYNSCFSLRVFDTYGDGICCEYGEGRFFVLNAEGDTLVTNNGDFGHNAEELFCPNGEGCVITAEIAATSATSEDANDGMLVINTSNGLAPFEYSIDGGVNYVNDNTFAGLAAGTYMIVIRDASQTCFFEETIELGIISDVVDLSSNNIRVFPNPTEENLIIEIDENLNVGGDLNIEIYNCLGRLVISNSIPSTGNSSNTFISLKEYAPGTYMVKCFNKDLEKNFVIIKI